MDYITGYYPNAKTQAQLDALVKCTLADFRLGLSYSVAVQIGELPDNATPPNFTPRFELKTKTVGEFTINTDLLVFQSDIRKGNAYTPVQATTTTTTTTTVP